MVQWGTEPGFNLAKGGYQVAERVFIYEYLKEWYDEIEPKEFYRAIFPVGELETHEQRRQGKYNGVAVELLPKEDNEKNNSRRYVITDELDILDKLLESDNFIIISPISYVGKSRQSRNARFIYAMAIDLDGISEIHNLVDFFYQVKNDYLPEPTYIVWSGTGVHLYYQFEQPIPCFKNITKQLTELKNALTRKIWNKYVSDLYKKPQIESLFQGFRMVGGVTKGGNRTRAFEVGKKVSIEYLNEFVPKESQVTEFKYKSKLTLKEAAIKYPEWYDKRIINKQPKGTWQANKAVYNWWLEKLHNHISEGHRYYGIMVLSIYAKKCGVSKEELEKDAFGLIDEMEKLTITDENHFTREDVLAALEMFNDNYITFPIDTITTLTAIQIEKNKRNGRKQALHLKMARSNKAILKEAGELKTEGRPSKRNEVIEWKRQHPTGTIKECMEDTGISKSTLYKYWKDEE